jgi:hypothetical protein
LDRRFRHHTTLLTVTHSGAAKDDNQTSAFAHHFAASFQHIPERIGRVREVYDGEKILPLVNPFEASG